MIKKICCINMLTLIILLMFTVSGFTENPQQKYLSFSNLTFEIATTKEEFVQVEPIPIILTLTNKTKKPISGHSALEFSYGLIDLFMGQKDGEMQKIENLSTLSSLSLIGSETIEPGKKHRATQVLIIELDKIFPEPGQYQIQAVLSDIETEERIQSNQLSINISKPVGLDSDALEFIKEKGNPSYFLSGLELIGNQEAQGVLEEFVWYYSKSAYGDYATSFLGRIYFFKEQYEQADELISELAIKENYAFADRALYYLIQTKVKLGDIEEAEYYFEMLNSRYPESYYIEQAERYI